MLNRTTTGTREPSVSILDLRGEYSEKELDQSQNAGPLPYTGSFESYEVSGARAAKV
jgi:hypothetical protein